MEVGTLLLNFIHLQKQYNNKTMSKCSTCKPIVSKTIVCSESVPCANPTPCSEILDASCFQYEGLGIALCNTDIQIVETSDSLELALKKIVEELCASTACNINIDIVLEQNLSLTAVVTGGTAPYTYNWSIAQAPFAGHSIFGSNTNQTVILNCIPENGIESEGLDAYMKITNVYLNVTDATGCVNNIYYYFTSDCYPTILAPPIPVLPVIESKLSTYTETADTPLTMGVMAFMDDAAKIPTCQELKYEIACVEGYPNHGDASTVFRAQRDCTLKAMNENALAENAGNPYHEIINYSNWLPGELNDKIVYVKGGLLNYSWIAGCPECTYAVWHEFYFDSLNQVIDIEIVETGSNIVNGVYENVEFTLITQSYNPPLYFTANITVEGNIVTDIEIVKKGSGYKVDDILIPKVGQLPEASCLPDLLECSSVRIGLQNWASCNLNVSTYANGDVIPYVDDPTEWSNLTTGAWCYYNNDPANEAVYGKLYNWYAINDPRGLAPAGWKIPTDDDWTILTDYLGGENVAGGKLKEAGTTHWLAPNTDAINNYDFTALPGGYRGNTGDYYNIGTNGYWWSSTENDTYDAWYRYLNFDTGNAYREIGSKKDGVSVRLIKTSIPLFKVCYLQLQI
jgi:uncharacterized protein (TIGR02145 family)